MDFEALYDLTDELDELDNQIQLLGLDFSFTKSLSPDEIETYAKIVYKELAQLNHPDHTEDPSLDLSYLTDAYNYLCSCQENIVAAQAELAELEAYQVEQQKLQKQTQRLIDRRKPIDFMSEFSYLQSTCSQGLLPYFVPAKLKLFDTATASTNFTGDSSHQSFYNLYRSHLGEQSEGERKLRLNKDAKILESKYRINLTIGSDGDKIVVEQAGAEPRVLMGILELPDLDKNFETSFSKFRRDGYYLVPFAKFTPFLRAIHFDFADGDTPSDRSYLLLTLDEAERSNLQVRIEGQLISVKLDC